MVMKLSPRPAILPNDLTDADAAGRSLRATFSAARTRRRLGRPSWLLGRPLRLSLTLRLAGLPAASALALGALALSIRTLRATAFGATAPGATTLRATTLRLARAAG
jgi:hypothetical protein